MFYKLTSTGIFPCLHRGWGSSMWVSELKNRQSLRRSTKIVIFSLCFTFSMYGVIRVVETVASECDLMLFVCAF